MPFQNNTDVGIGTYNGSRNILNIQPVIPIKLSAKLNLISRVVLPGYSMIKSIAADAVGQRGDQGLRSVLVQDAMPGTLAFW